MLFGRQGREFEGEGVVNKLTLKRVGVDAEKQQPDWSFEGEQFGQP